METQHRKKRQRTTGPSYVLPPAKKSRTDATVELLSQILKELKRPTPTRRRFGYQSTKTTTGPRRDTLHC